MNNTVIKLVNLVIITLCLQVSTTANTLPKVALFQDSTKNIQVKNEVGLTINSLAKMDKLFPVAVAKSENRGKRKGFILGFGVGPSYLNTSVKFNDGSTDNIFNKPAFLTDFIIGAGINEQLLIYYSSKVRWFSEEGFDGEDIVLTYGLGSLGATYFLNEAIVSPFVTAGIGFSSTNAPFEKEAEAEIGIGLYIGGGYQFTDHFLVQANLGYGNDGDDNFPFRTFTFDLSVNYLLY